MASGAFAILGSNCDGASSRSEPLTQGAVSMHAMKNFRNARRTSWLAICGASFLLLQAPLSAHSSVNTEASAGRHMQEGKQGKSSPFDEPSIACGIAQPAKTGWTGGRFGKRKGLPGGSSKTKLAVNDGLRWLKEHQDEDGRWDADQFMNHDPESDRCDGLGRANHDLGTTALALLAFLGDGCTTREGKYKTEVLRGLKWLRVQQDFEMGRFGAADNTRLLHDHALATLVMCEAFQFSYNPILAASAQKSLDFLIASRNTDGAWSASGQPHAETDLSTSHWALFALKTGYKSGLKVDLAILADVGEWLEKNSVAGLGLATATATTDSKEAMAALALLHRRMLSNPPATLDEKDQLVTFLLGTLPTSHGDQSPEKDLVYWYNGSYAMFQVGGEAWDEWNRAMKSALLTSQRSEGSAKGSWNPRGSRSETEGRVYATAMGVLCMEVHYRYARIPEPK